MKKKLKINRLIIIGVLIYFVFVLVSQQQTMNAYQEEAKVYENQIIKAQEKTEELKEIKNNIDSTEYIENIAREKLGMYLPNERVYIDITK